MSSVAKNACPAVSAARRADAAQISPAGEISEWGRTLHEHARRLRTNRRERDAAKFALGDFLNASKTHYGDRLYERAAKITGLSAKFLEQMAWVARNVPPENRDLRLPWPAYKAIAKLPSDEQPRWVASAAGREPKPSYEQLRDEIATDSESPPSEWPQPSLDDDHECPECRYRWSGHPVAPGTPVPAERAT